MFGSECQKLHDTVESEPAEGCFDSLRIANICFQSTHARLFALWMRASIEMKYFVASPEGFVRTRRGNIAGSTDKEHFHE
ncbi:MAG: hypothetical protein CVV27_20750 [Candidatus Melainabacteria bacterium HGW-Melainabacteria-1]|nr:MAG: hypothetical protein CVV27_20750 [Candidatus Melainabacteria bacterium HGW-Melainabacteria-1]